MRIDIFTPDDDPRNIDGFTIVIDVLRAFSVSYYILANHPQKYIVVGSVEQAFRLKGAIENSVLVGERQGIKVEGFDYGNSPTEIVNADFNGKTIIHTTTAGTKGLLAQKSENEVVVGSFVNAGALIGYIKEKHIERVNMYCTAQKEQMFGEEDYYFADYMRSMLTGGRPNFPEMVRTLRERTGKGFCDTGFAPASDFEYCMKLSSFDSVLKKKIVRNEDYEMELVQIR